MSEPQPSSSGAPDDYRIKSNKAWLFLAACLILATTIAIVIGASL